MIGTGVRKERERDKGNSIISERRKANRKMAGVAGKGA